MARTIEIVLQKGETPESAVRRFRQEVMNAQADIGGQFVDLCASSFDEHFVQQRNGKWRGKTLAAKYTIDSIRLNRSHLVELRQILRDLAGE
ncbi:MAG: hypothetical protein R2729_05235 [Bryobacteraceae bacterium]